MNTRLVFRVMLSILLSFVFIGLLSFSAFAEGESETLLRDLEDRVEAFLPEDIPDGFGEGGAQELSSAAGIHGILNALTDGLAGRKTEIVSFFLLLIASAILLSVAEHFSPEHGLSPAVTAGTSAVLCLPLFSRTVSLMQGVIRDIGDLTSFLSDVLPVYTAIQAAGGGTATAAVQAAGITFSTAVLGNFAEGILLPIVAFLLALAPITAIDAAGKVRLLAERVKKCFTFLLAAAAAVFSASLSLQQTVASAQDSAAIRAARYAAGMLPMVGGTLSGSLGVLSGGVAYLKSMLGVSSILLLISLFGAPLCELLLYRLALLAAVSLLGFFGGGQGERVLSGFCHALDALIAVFSLCSAVCILQAVLFLKSGVYVS